MNTNVDSSPSQVTLAGQLNGDSFFGQFLSINWGWAVGVTLGAIVAGSVSGGHMNPAVTFAFALVGESCFYPREDERMARM